MPENSTLDLSTFRGSLRIDPEPDFDCNLDKLIYFRVNCFIPMKKKSFSLTPGPCFSRSSFIFTAQSLPTSFSLKSAWYVIITTRSFSGIIVALLSCNSNFFILLSKFLICYFTFPLNCFSSATTLASKSPPSITRCNIEARYPSFPASPATAAGIPYPGMHSER